jgi:hypothetical protein
MLGSGSPVSLSLGQLGSLYITDTGAHAGDWGAITALEATVVATLVSGFRQDGTTAVVAGTLTSVPIPSGCTIFGRFTSITLASGKVLAYNL